MYQPRHFNKLVLQNCFNNHHIDASVIANAPKCTNTALLVHFRSIGNDRSINMMVVEAVLEHQFYCSGLGWYMTRHYKKGIPPKKMPSKGMGSGIGKCGKGMGSGIGKGHPQLLPVGPVQQMPTPNYSNDAEATHWAEQRGPVGDFGDTEMLGATGGTELQGDAEATHWAEQRGPVGDFGDTEMLGSTGDTTMPDQDDEDVRPPWKHSRKHIF
jgi:hypothetical protein